MLYRRKWPALAVFVVAVAVAVIRASLVPPVYRATTRILIEKTQAQNIGLNNPMYNYWDPDFYRTQVQIIQQRGDRRARRESARRRRGLPRAVSRRRRLGGKSQGADPAPWRRNWRR